MSANLPTPGAAAATLAAAQGSKPGRLAMDSIDRVLGRIEGWVIITSYATLIVLVGFETLRRAITQQQAVWGPEVALYAFVWLSWFSMSKHCRYGTHLAFSELRRKSPVRVQQGLEVLDCCLWLALGAIIIATSYGVVRNHLTMGQVVFGTSVPLAAASLSVPIGWGFSMARILQRMYLVVFRWPEIHRSAGPDLVL